MIGRPFLPEHRTAKSTMLDDIVGNMICTGLALGGGDGAELAAEMFPHLPNVKRSFTHPNEFSISGEKTSEFVTKATATPLMTTTSGAPVGTGLVHFQPLLPFTSLANQLIAASPSVETGQNASMGVPTYTPDGTGVAYVAEAGPAPMRQIDLGSVTIGGIKKLMLGTSASRELYESPGAQTFLKEFVALDLARGFEGILLDATAADTTRPAGLANGVSGTTTDAGSGVEAMLGDLGSLAAACSQTGSTNFIFAMSLTQYVRFMMRKPPSFPYQVYPTAALNEGEVACFAVDAILFSGGGVPRWSTSKETVLVMRDDPGQVSVTGTPNVVSAPTRSLFQTDAVGLKLVMKLDFVKRHADAYHFISNVNW